MFAQHDDNVQKQAEVQQDEDEDDDKGHTPEDCCCVSMCLSVKMMKIRSQSVINNSSDTSLSPLRVLPLLSFAGYRHVPGHREGLV